MKKTTKQNIGIVCLLGIGGLATLGNEHLMPTQLPDYNYRCNRPVSKSVPYDNLNYPDREKLHSRFGSANINFVKEYKQKENLDLKNRAYLCGTTALVPDGMLKL